MISTIVKAHNPRFGWFLVDIVRYTKLLTTTFFSSYQMQGKLASQCAFSYFVILYISANFRLLNLCDGLSV